MNEKLEIALHKGDDLLNKRSEIISQRRHRNNNNGRVAGILSSYEINITASTRSEDLLHLT